MRNSLLVTALFSAALASAAQAAQPDDAWLALAGCWRAEGDTSQRSLCVVPDGEGVRMITLNAGKIESETRIVANGQPRSITQEGCTGTETANWSADRQRVFLRAELNCGNNVMRKVSGMFAVISGSQWASVQAITTAGNTSVHKVRYAESEPENLPANIAQSFRDNRLARQTVRLGASSPLDLADVIDASAKADTAVVQGWLTTVNQEFDLDAAQLIQLSDAGVPGSVIDVLIAVSNPRFFAVRDERANDDMRGRRRRPVGCLDSYWYDPYDPFAYRGAAYHPHGNGCGGWYGPSWGGYYGGGYYGGGSVIVIDRGSIRNGGRVTREGYKKPRDNDSSPSTGTVASQPTKTPTSTGSSSSGSSDDSSSSGGRKAKPRDN
jgi:hypothetical protein